MQGPTLLAGEDPVRCDRLDLQTQNRGETRDGGQRLRPRQTRPARNPGRSRNPGWSGRGASRRARAANRRFAQKNNSCKTNRRRPWISVTTTNAICGLPCSTQVGATRSKIFPPGAPGLTTRTCAGKLSMATPPAPAAFFIAMSRVPSKLGGPFFFSCAAIFKETQRALFELKKHEVPSCGFVEGSGPASNRPAIERSRTRAVFSHHH